MFRILFAVCVEFRIAVGCVGVCAVISESAKLKPNVVAPAGPV
jgi:hypothetical protein